MASGWSPSSLNRSIARIEDVATTIRLVDATTLELWSDAHHDYNNPLQTSSYWGPYRGRVRLSHNDGFNALFVDGHVKWLKESTRSMWTTAAD